ncbi:MAG: DUF2634 domain-containing protein [Gammaproteobacteria bacterium]|nr:DUF2634 domain-containing protein [Gammaproteobacteria bacterium]
MKTYKTDENGDPIVKNGYFVIIEGIEAVMQSCEQAAKTLKGEMVYFTGGGVDYQNTVWSRLNPSQFEASFKAQIMKVDGVLSVPAFDMTQKGDLMRYFADIKTTFGTGSINGTI